MLANIQTQKTGARVPYQSLWPLPASDLERYVAMPDKIEPTQ